MRHNWVFDVLTDLLTYSQCNELPALALRVQDALAVARLEIPQADRDGDAGQGNSGGLPPASAHH